METFKHMKFSEFLIIVFTILSLVIITVVNASVKNNLEKKYEALQKENVVLTAQLEQCQNAIGIDGTFEADQYTPNDILYFYGDSTGVTIRSESTPFYFRGSYVEAIQTAAILAEPLPEDDPRPYWNLQMSIMGATNYFRSTK